MQLITMPEMVVLRIQEDRFECSNLRMDHGRESRILMVKMHRINQVIALVLIRVTGSTIAIGAPCTDGNGRRNSGHVRVHDWDGSINKWVRKGATIDCKSVGISTM